MTGPRQERKTTRDLRIVSFPVWLSPVRNVCLGTYNLQGNLILKGLKMFSDQQSQRPTMRRKSSAQNLLSSFKSTSSSGSVTPQSLNPPASLVSNATTLSFSSTTSSTATAPQTREWDAQSLHSDTVGSNMGGAQSPSLTPGTSVEYLRDLVQKRIITLTYIRQIHEG